MGVLSRFLRQHATHVEVVQRYGVRLVVAEVPRTVATVWDEAIHGIKKIQVKDIKVLTDGVVFPEARLVQHRYQWAMPVVVGSAQLEETGVENLLADCGLSADTRAVYDPNCQHTVYTPTYTSMVVYWLVQAVDKVCRFVRREAA